MSSVFCTVTATVKGNIIIESVGSQEEKDILFAELAKHGATDVCVFNADGTSSVMKSVPRLKKKKVTPKRAPAEAKTPCRGCSNCTAVNPRSDSLRTHRMSF